MLYSYVDNVLPLQGDGTFEINYLSPNIRDIVVIHFPKHSYDSDVPTPEHHAVVCQKIFDVLENFEYSYILATVGITETTDPKFTHPLTVELIKLFDRLKPKLKNYCIIFNTTTSEKNYPESSNILVLPWFLCSNYSWYEHTGFPEDWKPTNTEILFLPGKLDKIARLPLLYHLLNSNLKSNLVYSCNKEYFDYHINENYYNTLEHLMNQYTGETWSRQTLEVYLEKIKRSVDLTQHDQNMLFCVPKEIYDNISIELLSETDTSVIYNLSEKSLRPLVIGYPFVHFNRSFRIHIQGLGFKTFDNVLHTENFVNGKTYEEQNFIFFQQVIADLQTFKENLSVNEEKIQETINHNKKHSKDLYQIYIAKISEFIPMFKDCYSLFFSRHISYDLRNKPFESLKNLRTSA